MATHRTAVMAPTPKTAGRMGIPSLPSRPVMGTSGLLFVKLTVVSPERLKLASVPVCSDASPTVYLVV
jgi:hypothetical protein